MPKLPRLTAAESEAMLLKADFAIARSAGPISPALHQRFNLILGAVPHARDQSG